MQKVVCFDLGGVLAHVTQTWNEAFARIGVTIANPPLKLETISTMVDYQSGRLDEIELYRGLAQHFSVTEEQAKSAFDAILIEPTQGTLEIVTRLNEAGVRTACLSNTNAPHWRYLTDPAHYPNIASLQLKFASHIWGLSKPDEAIFRKFEAETSTESEDIYFFEDNKANCEAARQCGWNVRQIDPHQPQQGQISLALHEWHILSDN